MRAPWPVSHVPVKVEFHLPRFPHRRSLWFLVSSASVPCSSPPGDLCHVGQAAQKMNCFLPAHGYSAPCHQTTRSDLHFLWRARCHLDCLPASAVTRRRESCRVQTIDGYSVAVHHAMSFAC